MKILQINCVYGTGSTGRLTQAIHTRLLAEGIKSVVCCGRGPRSADADRNRQERGMEAV